MMNAYTAVWGRDPRKVDYQMSGKTELGISHELLGLLGFSRQEVDAGMPRFWQRYPEELQRAISPETTTVFPGIPELVRAVEAHENLVLGLLTGNCKAAAEIKVKTAGLDGFRVGAFGEHHEDRADLPALAVREAKRLTGVDFAGKSVVILGDTPNDIRCGRAAGAKTIAVATGRRFDTAELGTHQPDHLFEDFSSVTDVMAAIQAS